ESAAALRDQFACGEFDPQDPVGLLYVFADAVSYAIQYTNEAPASSGYRLKQLLCDRWMLNATETDGQPISPGSSLVKDEAYAFAGFFSAVLGRLNETCTSFTTTLPLLNNTSIAPEFNQRQWYWQSCLSWGFFQTAPNPTLPDQPQPVRSTR